MSPWGVSAILASVGETKQSIGCSIPRAAKIESNIFCLFLIMAIHTQNGWCSYSRISQTTTFTTKYNSGSSPQQMPVIVVALPQDGRAQRNHGWGLRFV